jgi:hypothetical protein
LIGGIGATTTGADVEGFAAVTACGADLLP